MGRSIKKDGALVKNITNIDQIRALSSQDKRESVCKSTLIKYHCGFRSFSKFCLQFHQPFIPDVQNLSDYISYTSRKISPRSVQAYLVGITHIFNLNFPSVIVETRHLDVRKVMKHCLLEFSEPVVRKNPLTVKQIELVVEKSSGSFDEKLFLAMLGMGFAGLHRLGELTIPDSKNLFDDRKTILRSLFQFSTCKNFCRYRLPYSKSDSKFLGTEIMFQNFENTSACPIKLLKSYLRVRDTNFISSTPFFVTSNGSQPSRSWFLARFHSFFDKSFSGHSLQSGGATALAQAGYSLDDIKSAGRWSSEAFLIYIRGHVALRLPANKNNIIGHSSHVGANVSLA